MKFARRAMGDDVHRRDRAELIERVGNLPERIAFGIEQIGPHAGFEAGNQFVSISDLAVDEDELPHCGNFGI